MTITDYFLFVLTESQMDKVLEIVASSLRALQEGVKAVWILIAPALGAWLVWKQHSNNKARKEGQDAIAKKIEDNTEITTAAKETVDAMARIRGMVTKAVRPSQGKMIEFTLQLPGYAYEKFTLSEGSPVLWKSEPCDVGRKTRWAVSGPASMGFHAHDVTEKLYVVTGVLVVVTDSGTFHIGPGEEFISPPDQIHSVAFCGFGEVVAHWPEQQTSDLNIRIYQ